MEWEIQDAGEIWIGIKGRGGEEIEGVWRTPPRSMLLCCRVLILHTACSIVVVMVMVVVVVCIHQRRV
jgi:hypothetical protein